MEFLFLSLGIFSFYLMTFVSALKIREAENTFIDDGINALRCFDKNENTDHLKNEDISKYIVTEEKEITGKKNNDCFQK